MVLHQTSGRWRLGIGLSLLTVLLWGIEPILLSIMLQELDVYTLIWFRFLVCSCLLLIFLGVKKQLPTLEKLQKISWKLLAIAIVFLAVKYVLFLQGIAQTSPANGEIFIQLSSVFMGLGGILIFKESYNLVQWFGLGVITLGLTLFFHNKLQILVTSATQYWIGTSLIIVSAMASAVYSLAQKQLMQKLSSANILLLIYIISTLIFSFFANPQAIFQLSPFYLVILFLCVIDTLISYGAFAESLQHLESSKVSAILFLSPIVTLLSMWLFSSLLPYIVKPEEIQYLGIFGAILVVLGAVAITLEQKT